MEIDSNIRNRYNSQFFRDEFGKLILCHFRNPKNETSIIKTNKINNIKKNYLPLIKVKNFQISNYQFKKYLNIYNSSNEKFHIVQKEKNNISFSSKNITNISKKKLNMKDNYSINLDYNVLTRSMKEKRMKNDQILEEILNKSEFDKKKYLKLISFRLNIPFIRDIEKKRKDYIIKRSFIKSNSIN